MPRRKSVDISLDGLAGKLGAKIFGESPGFVYLLPQDIHESVLGRGGSVAEAINNWYEKLKAHLRNSTAGDPIVDYVQKILRTTIPDHIQSFYNQFYRSGKNSNLYNIMDNQQNSQANFRCKAASNNDSEKLTDSADGLDRHETENDFSSLEPQEFATNEGVLNVDDAGELSHWAEQFQISTDELKSVALLQGDSIREIKKYLSA